MLFNTKLKSIGKDSISSYPFVILPGFGNDEMDYFNPLNNGFEGSIKNSLQSRGIEHVSIVPIKRSQWLNIARAVFTLDFWKNECKPCNLFDFYFKEVDRTVRDLQKKHQKPVVLIGHSAGGWIARAILADGKWGVRDEKDKDLFSSSDLVIGVVTLGAPHFPPAENTMCMTRGALKYVDTEYPGAFLQDECGIFYITVGGSAVMGNSAAPKGTPELFAAGSYKQVTGSTDELYVEAGDGVVPLKYTHLEGAQQITIPEAWHSIQAPSNEWYGGADKIVDRWFPQTLKALEKAVARKRKLKV